MSRTVSLAALAVILVLALVHQSLRAASPATQPSADNSAAEITKLKAQVADLTSQNQLLQTQLNSTSARLDLAKDRLAQLSQKIIELEHSLTSSLKPAPAPSPFSLTIPPQQTPPNSRSFPYNGRTVYVEPIAHDDILSIVAPQTAGAKSDVYQTIQGQGTLIDNRAKP